MSDLSVIRQLEVLQPNNNLDISWNIPGTSAHNPPIRPLSSSSSYPRNIGVFSSWSSQALYFPHVLYTIATRWSVMVKEVKNSLYMVLFQICCQFLWNRYWELLTIVTISKNCLFIIIFLFYRILFINNIIHIKHYNIYQTCKGLRPGPTILIILPIPTTIPISVEKSVHCSFCSTGLTTLIMITILGTKFIRIGGIAMQSIFWGPGAIR